MTRLRTEYRDRMRRVLEAHDAGKRAVAFADKALENSGGGVHQEEEMYAAMTRARVANNEALTARVERLEAALREIADAYDGYDTWSHTTQRRMLRAVEEARAALGDAPDSKKGPGALPGP